MKSPDVISEICSDMDGGVNGAKLAMEDSFAVFLHNNIQSCIIKVFSKRIRVSSFHSG